MNPSATNFHDIYNSPIQSMVPFETSTSRLNNFYEHRRRQQLFPSELFPSERTNPHRPDSIDSPSTPSRTLKPPPTTLDSNDSPTTPPHKSKPPPPTPDSIDFPTTPPDRNLKPHPTTDYEEEDSEAKDKSACSEKDFTDSSRTSYESDNEEEQNYDYCEEEEEQNYDYCEEEDDDKKTSLVDATEDASRSQSEEDSFDEDAPISSFKKLVQERRTQPSRRSKPDFDRHSLMTDILENLQKSNEEDDISVEYSDEYSDDDDAEFQHVDSEDSSTEESEEEANVEGILQLGTEIRKQRRHNFAFTVSQKIGILKLAERWGSDRYTANYFGVDPKSIRNWRKNVYRIKEKILINPNARTVHNGKPAIYPELEEQLNEWCESMFMENITFKTDNILHQALQIEPNLKNSNEKKCGDGFTTSWSVGTFLFVK
jgi:hypothetical protein